MTSAERRRHNLDTFLGVCIDPTPAERATAAHLPDAPDTSINGYDYTHQAWVVDGRYEDCSHVDESCGCYGRAHKGQPVAPDADVH
jgi:hypothetical protein